MPRSLVAALALLVASACTPGAAGTPSAPAQSVAPATSAVPAGASVLPTAPTLATIPRSRTSCEIAFYGASLRPQDPLEIRLDILAGTAAAMCSPEDFEAAAARYPWALHDIAPAEALPRVCEITARRSPGIDAPLCP